LSVKYNHWHAAVMNGSAPSGDMSLQSI